MGLRFFNKFSHRNKRGFFFALFWHALLLGSIVSPSTIFGDYAVSKGTLDAVKGAKKKELESYKISDIFSHFFPQYSLVYYSSLKPETKIDLPSGLLSQRRNIRSLMPLLLDSGIIFRLNPVKRRVSIARVVTLKLALARLFPDYKSTFYSVSPATKVIWLSNTENGKSTLEQERKNFIEWIGKRYVSIKVDPVLRLVSAYPLVSLLRTLRNNYPDFQIKPGPRIHSTAIGAESAKLIGDNFFAFKKNLESKKHIRIYFDGPRKLIRLVKLVPFTVDSGSLRQNISRLAKEFNFRLIWRAINERTEENIDFSVIGNQIVWGETIEDLLGKLIISYPIRVGVYQKNRIIVVDRNQS